VPVVLTAALVVGGFPAAKAAGFSEYQLGEFYPLSEVDEAVVHEASAAVVRFPNATGFIVDPDGLILTNHHVYETFGERGTVWRRWIGDGSEQALTIELVRKDATHDVALYQVVGEHPPFPSLELRETAVRPGERVFVLGHPSGDPLRASFGKVLADDLTIGGRPSIEYSAQTWWGSSGSPVLDSRGRAVAIHWGWDSTGISNGRLTGVPATLLLELAGFEALGSDDDAIRCDAKGWSLDSTLIDARAKQNASGRWLDRVELRPVHADRKCVAAIDSVTFRLHPSFADPVVRVDGDEPLTIHSWGFFDATVELELADGRAITFVDRVAWK
jgi:hypothetical protein